MSGPVRLALCGAGAVGRKHAAAIAGAGATLCAVAEPNLRGTLAEWPEASIYPDLEALLRSEQPDGIIIATPNAFHRAHALSAIAAGIPALVEKPIATDVADGQAIVDAAATAGLPVAVGHHRRHGAALQEARRIINDGVLGAVRVIHCSAWLHKPDTYFDLPWRRSAGAGPILVNLIHDIDSLRFLFGEIAAVEAMAAASQRGHAVEDTAAVLIRFASGALCTVSVTDAATAPWSWERTAQENPMYPPADTSAIWVAGSAAALSLPDLTVWRHDGAADWTVPLAAEALSIVPRDPLVAQIENFCAAIRGETPLVCPAIEGLATLCAVQDILAKVHAGNALAAKGQKQLHLSDRPG